MATFLRLIALVLLAVLARPAAAATINHAEQGEAYSACQSAKAAVQGMEIEFTGNSFTQTSMSINCTGPGSAGSGFSQYTCQARFTRTGGSTTILRGCTTTADNFDYYKYPTSANCTARNAVLGQPERVYTGAPPTCAGGCTLGHGGQISTIVNGVTLTQTTNTAYTGTTCSNSPLVDEPEPPGPTTPDADKACTSLPNNQTACVKPDGKYCATASTGKEFCWTASQTGEQSADGTLQQRVPGLQRPTTPPVTPPPTGETWNPNESHNTASPQNGSHTIINNTIVPGDSGNTDIGGDEGGDDGEEEGDPDAGSTTGGGDCSAAPACSGTADNATIQCALVQQAWLARCSATVAGEGVACSANVPLVCTNMSPKECFAASLAKKAACNLEGIGDAVTGEVGEGEGPPDLEASEAWADGNGGNGDGEEGIDLDTGGWLSSRSCPNIASVSVKGRTISFNAVTGDVCTFFNITAALILMFAAWWSIRVLGET